MKLQAIKAACKERGVFLAMDAIDGRQWMSNGCAFWPVEGIEITKENIPAIFDIEPKKQKEYQIERMKYEWDERIRLEPMSDYEIELKDMGNILSGSTIYKALKNENGLMLIDTAWLKPIDSRGQKYTFFERWHKARKPLVAVYTDFFVGGILATYTGDEAEKILEGVRDIVNTPVYGHEEEAE